MYSQSLRNHIPVRVVVFALSVALVAAPLPHARATTARKSPPKSGTDAGLANDLVPATQYFLRDAVPSTGFATEPEDTTDELFMPEEKETKQLVWEIAAWVVGAALVAFFIIKVFIEEDPDESDESGNNKPDPF